MLGPRGRGVEVGLELSGLSGPPTLPEREEDHGLDSEELEDGLEGPQELLGGEVEEGQGIERQADGGVVQEGDVEVAAAHAGARAEAGVRQARAPHPPTTPTHRASTDPGPPLPSGGQ